MSSEKRWLRGRPRRELVVDDGGPPDDELRVMPRERAEDVPELDFTAAIDAVCPHCGAHNPPDIEMLMSLRSNPRLRGKVRIDDCYWVIDDDYEGGRALQVVLAKASTFTKWEGLFVE